MTKTRPNRVTRLYSETRKEGEHRSPAQRDRDRLLYTSAFLRLAEVTQVVAPTNAHVFHNRLTHSLQVAQVGRRIAEILLATQRSEIRKVGGLDPDAVEASCLAHDIGHPPFGHVAEQELNTLASEAGLRDGFEGNAQSFRIVTQLAFRTTDNPGLNLSCATLGGILKYPWGRGDKGKHAKKWGVYDSELSEFKWVRSRIPLGAEQRTLEAELMDWADDVTYSIHDLEDFYRAGRIPLHLLSKRKEADERERFFREVFKRRAGEDGVWKLYSEQELREAFEAVVGVFDINEPYAGTQTHRARLRRFTGYWIGEYINAIRVNSRLQHHARFVVIDPKAEKQVAMLKELTWHYVITDPAMAAIQHGQRRIICELFKVFSSTVSGSNLDLALFPNYYREQLDKRADRPSHERLRLVVDLISGMTERQAAAMCHRLTGTRTGSPFETILH